MIRAVKTGQLFALACGFLLLPWVGPALAAPPAKAARGQASAQQAPAKKKSRRGKKKRRAAKKEAPQEEAAESQVGESGAPAEPGNPTTTTEGAANQPAGGGSLRRSNKMEFDARLIRGETAGSGAVILFDRGQRRLPPLTTKRTRFLEATLREVYGGRSRKRGD